MLLLYGLTATGDDAAPSVLETLKMSPAPVCTCVTAFPAQPPACLGPSASLAGEGIRSGEWLLTLLMPSLGDHQVHSISWQEHKGPGISRFQWTCGGTGNVWQVESRVPRRMEQT